MPPQTTMPPVTPTPPPTSTPAVFTTPPQIPPTSSPTPSSKLLLLLLILALVILAAGAVWYFTAGPRSSNEASQETTTVKSEPFGNGEVAPASDITWYDNPVTLPDLKLFAYKGMNYNMDSGESTLIIIPQEEYPLSYKEIGERDGKKIIFAHGGYDVTMVAFGATLLFFEKDANGSYSLIKNMSDAVVSATDDNEGPFIAMPGVTIDNTTTYSDLKPTEFSYGGLTFTPVPGIDISRSVTNTEGYTIESIATVSEHGELFLQKAVDFDSNGNTQSVKYIAKSPAGFFHTFTVSFPFMTDDSVPHITWNDGAQNTSPFTKGFVVGCGSAGWTQLALGDISSLLQVVGTTNTGEAVYGFKDLSSTQARSIYTTQGKRYTGGQMQQVPESEWLQSHGVIFYKNFHGAYMPFGNSTFSSGAECGKPVIYLYPTKETDVKVSVGADVTVSEPSYGNGWSVRAKPNGSLKLTDGRTFDYLFWEGTGHGPYPLVQSGTVIANKDVEQTLRKNLKDLGLNTKESADFMEFWLPLMPKTPYVRLTWFTTSDMNKLAPLHITPKPDTMIRVFLDFSGLEKPINIPSQILSSIPRKGFTVVEWGGLLVK